jgi:DNA-binding transcriptional ArsR family regulator
MKLSRSIVTISLTLIILVAFAVTIIQRQKNTNLTAGTLSGKTDLLFVSGFRFNPLTPTNYWSPIFFPPSTYYADIPETLAAPQRNSTRTEIYDFIAANPGVSFRGICNALGLSIGLAQFHLGVLTKAGLVSYIRDGKYKRFFAANRFSKKQMKIIAVLRHKTVGIILKTLLEDKQLSHRELTHELSITSQGLTWHINRLEKSHLITETRNGKNQLYSLHDASAPVLAEMAKHVK